MIELNRRRVLRGMLGGSAVTVGLPLLNCFLNGNGSALADGKPIPIRLGTWFWGLGMTSNVFVPKQFGKNYELPDEASGLKVIQDKMNMITNLTAFRDNEQNLCHYSGWVISRAGTAPKAKDILPAGETFDVTVANQIGRTTRFKTLSATATGDARNYNSYENPTSPSTPEISPVEFYTRLFGPDFPDPNAASFTPNPRTMVRKSVLSGVLAETKDLEKKIGADDRARLDQYFTGLRHLEKQFDQQLTRPEPIAACIVPKPIEKDVAPGRESGLVAQRHRLMTDLLAMAVACDQTRVFNLSYSASSADSLKTGYEKPHHTATHEEPVDEHVGYQPNVSWFVRRSMESWVYFVQAFDKVKEGDGTLLDNMFIYADTDHGYARVHSLDGMTLMTAGRAGGKVKTGLHVDGKTTATTRVTYTTLRLMGIDVQNFGTKSNNTNKEFGEILV